MDSSPRAQGHGPALIRLLARISGDALPLPQRSPTARLAHWIDWRQAVTLAAALDLPPRPGSTGIVEEGGESARVRASLADAIRGDRAFSTSPTEPGALVDGAFFRQRYLGMQQVMEAEVGLLRKRLRDRLARQGGAPGRLAAVDAVLERALAVQERRLLGPLPDLLAGYFDRLMQAAPAAAASAHAGGSTMLTDASLASFRRDMRHLLLAELDVRLTPIEGLLAALHLPIPGHHAQ